jgi:MFS family permease
VTDGRNRAAIVAWVSALFAAALLIGWLSLVFVERPTGDDAATAGIGGVLGLGLGILFAIVGALIVTRHPRHLIGWIYTATGLLIGLAGFSLAYSRLAQQLFLPFAQLADAVFGVTFFAGFLLPITLGLLLFPDGHLVSRGWRAAVLITVIGYVGIVGVNALAQRPEYETLHTAAGFGALTLPAAVLASVASLILRWRRSVGVERQQLKWVGAVALLLGLDLIAVILLASFGAIPESGGVTFVLLALGIALLPMAVGIAILRYRLYDIDVLINRTLVYGALSAALAATYFVAVLTFETVLRPVTAGSELSVALSTLAVVALFTPLRARLQQFVDRRFYRSRYDAERTVDAFSVRIRDEVALDALRGDLLTVVGDTMQPVHVSLWLRGAR